MTPEQVYKFMTGPLKYLTYGGLGVFGAAEVLDINNDMNHKVNLGRQRVEQERRLKAREKNYKNSLAGLPNDPYLGLVQDMFDMRTNHHRM